MRLDRQHDVTTARAERLSESALEVPSANYQMLGLTGLALPYNGGKSKSSDAKAASSRQITAVMQDQQLLELKV